MMSQGVSLGQIEGHSDLLNEFQQIQQLTEKIINELGGIFGTRQ
jgi:hypothetical protein